MENFLLNLSPTKTNLERENIGYQMTGQNGVPCNTSGCMSDLEAIRSLREFQAESHLSKHPPILPNWF